MARRISLRCTALHNIVINDTPRAASSTDTCWQRCLHWRTSALPTPHAHQQQPNLQVSSLLPMRTQLMHMLLTTVVALLFLKSLFACTPVCKSAGQQCRPQPGCAQHNSGATKVKSKVAVPFGQASTSPVLHAPLLASTGICTGLAKKSDSRKKFPTGPSFATSYSEHRLAV
ncbi:hypothetical protein COO60DRAFT_960213 [Scenedesmus sp. NREL 46B-D3]|nr:hypothetical protein COO60DRAFT_960213 [Scenedesmus sp. NREL 46B-D3]